MNAAFITARITATEAMIAAYEDAATSLAGGVQSYTLDTGQSRQTATKLDLAAIQKTIDALYNRLTTLEARLTGSGTITGVPSW